MTLQVKLVVNGSERRVEVPDDESLCDTLRGRLRLTGTKVGCREGVCGSCDVTIDGAVVRSCLFLTAQAEGCGVTTVEGLAEDGVPSRLQDAFVAQGAAQCGFCTAGMLVAATHGLATHPDPTDEQIASMLDGNLCRCTGYAKIVDAVRAASEDDRG